MTSSQTSRLGALLASVSADPRVVRLIAFAKRGYGRLFDPRVTRPAGIAVQLIAAAIVVYLVATNWSTLTQVKWSLQPGALALVLAAYVCVFGCWAVAWRAQVSIIGAGMFKRELRVHAYNNLIRRIPFVNGAWMYVGKPVFYEAHGFAKRRVLALTALDTGLQTASVAIAACALLAVGSPWAARQPGLAPALVVPGAIGIVLLAAVALAPLTPIGKWVGMSDEGVIRLRRGALAATAVYWVGWAFAGLSAWAFYAGTTDAFRLPYGDAAFHIAAAGTFGYVVGLIPAPLRGVTELSYAFLVASYFDTPLAGVIALGYVLVMAVVEVGLCALVIALTRPRTPAAT